MTKKEKTNLHKMVRECVMLRDRYCLYFEEKNIEENGVKTKEVIRCGKTTSLHASHIYPRGKYPKMAFDPLNVKALCMRHHLYWWHKHPIEAKEWLEKAIDADRLSSLKRRSNTIDKNPLIYSDIKKDLEKQIKFYQNEYNLDHE